MKKIQIILLFILSVTMMNAQDISGLLKKADAAANSFDFDKAIKVLNDGMSENPSDNTIKEKLANIYLTPGPTQNDNMATKLLSEIYSSGNMTPTAQLRFANLLQTQKDFERAKSVFSNYAGRSISSNNFIKNLSSDYYTKITEMNSSYQVKNVEALNTRNSDFSPQYYRNGLTFVSTRKTRNNTGFKSQDEIVGNFTDIFKATRTDLKTQAFELPTLLLKNEGIQKYMQGPMTFTDEYGAMYITRSTAKDEKSLKSSEDKQSVFMEICKVNYSNGDVENWDQIVPIVLNRGENYQNFSYAHPTFLTGRGDEMIFSSNMPGGYGATDLWYSKLNGTEWSTPVNLGSEINTAGEEMFPYVGKDGSLFYSSNGLPGLGGLDIFKAANLGGTNNYGNVENLGVPFNSKFDDFGYITEATGREGYFTSNRMGGKGLDDIYSWGTEETCMDLKVVVATTSEPIANAEVKIPCLGNKKLRTDANGMAQVCFTNIKTCELFTSADGYKNNTTTLRNIQGNKLIVIPMEKDAEERCKIIVQVLDRATNQPIPDCEVFVKKIANGEEVTGTTKSDGRIRVKGISMNETYEISAKKTNEDGSRYIGHSDNATCKGLRNGDSVLRTIYLDRAKVGQKFKIENIYYDLDKWFIRKEAAVELDKIVALMQRNSTMEIELGSHTDCRSSYKYNMDLSAKRAASAVDYIISRGISKSRIIDKGYGETQLTNGCACEGAVKSKCSEPEHQLNRRTEFTILKF